MAYFTQGLTMNLSVHPPLPRFTIDAGELADLDAGERYEISFAGVV